MKTLSKYKGIDKIYMPVKTSDGAGVRLQRSIGSMELDNLDPFLLLDEFKSDNPDDYIAGFPSHPHRGFETVTYMLAGSMKHKDSTGAEGELEAGSVQWMTAGRGVIHSEIPIQKDGLIWGFQLWVNLPAKDKMTNPRYQNIEPDQVPEVKNDDGTVTRVIAGDYNGVKGAVCGITTDPLYLDVHLSAGGNFQEPIPDEHTVFAYVYDGSVRFGDSSEPAKASSLVTFGAGESIRATSADGGRFLLIAGHPIKEPIARGGPFVMNTQEEIMQAFADYRDGTLTK